MSAFKYLKNCLDDDLVSFTSFCFLFREPKIHKIAIFSVLRLQCFLQPAKNYADPLLTAKSGWLLAGILCQGLGNRCKNARRLTFLRVPFLVQGCLPEINIETNPTYFCRVNDAGCALDLRPACQNLGVPAPKWTSCKRLDSIFFHIKAVDTNWRFPLAYLFFLDIACVFMLLPELENIAKQIMQKILFSSRNTCLAYLRETWLETPPLTMQLVFLPRYAIHACSTRDKIITLTSRASSCSHQPNTPWALYDLLIQRSIHCWFPVSRHLK